MFRLAFGSQRGPGGIERGEPQRLGVLGLGLQPAIDVIGEAALGERFEQEGFELGADREAVDGGGLFGRVAGERFALDEFPLHGIERRQFVMARLQLAQFAIECRRVRR